MNAHYLLASPSADFTLEQLFESRRLAALAGAEDAAADNAGAGGIDQPVATLATYVLCIVEPAVAALDNDDGVPPAVRARHLAALAAHDGCGHGGGACAVLAADDARVRAYRRAWAESQRERIDAALDNETIDADEASVMLAAIDAELAALA